MKKDSTLLVGVFYDRIQTEKALRDLQNGGFREDQIRITLCEADLTSPPPPIPEPPTKAKTGAGIGLAVGTAAGGLLGGFITGWLPGIGPIIAVGFLAGILGSTAAGAGLGSLLGLWIGSRLREQVPRPPVQITHVSRGILTVRPDGRYDEVAAILMRHAGCDVPA
jgi:hypothetical protein